MFVSAKVKNVSWRKRRRCLRRHSAAPNTVGKLEVPFDFRKYLPFIAGLVFYWVQGLMQGLGAGSRHFRLAYDCMACPGSRCINKPVSVPSDASRTMSIRVGVRTDPKRLSTGSSLTDWDPGDFPPPGSRLRRRLEAGLSRRRPFMCDLAASSW
ncbi:hypothetical protein BJ170DRAFT_82655 [Xylariales sp. AK1849]|nr:hypothetical protein BJ170DRAFT_82655 [Xylariales sp. AK1849]